MPHALIAAYGGDSVRATLKFAEHITGEVRLITLVDFDNDGYGSGDPLFVIADTRELEFEATVPSEHVALVRVGAAVTLTLDADLQDDPKEIPRFLDMLEQGYDLVNTTRTWRRPSDGAVSSTSTACRPTTRR